MGVCFKACECTVWPRQCITICTRAAVGPCVVDWLGAVQHRLHRVQGQTTGLDTMYSASAASGLGSANDYVLAEWADVYLDGCGSRLLQLLLLRTEMYRDGVGVWMVWDCRSPQRWRCN